MLQARDIVDQFLLDQEQLSFSTSVIDVVQKNNWMKYHEANIQICFPKNWQNLMFHVFKMTKWRNH